MKLSKIFAVAVILCSIGLAACGTQADTQPEIFKTLSQSESLTNNASEIKCEDSADYPEAQYHRLCFQFNEVTMTNLDEGQNIGLEMGLSISAIIKEVGYESQSDDSDEIFYVKSMANGCAGKMFVDVDVDGMAEDNSNINEFPIQFAPIFNFSKLRQADCEKN